MGFTDKRKMPCFTIIRGKKSLTTADWRKKKVLKLKENNSKICIEKIKKKVKKADKMNKMIYIFKQCERKTILK